VNGNLFALLKEERNLMFRLLPAALAVTALLFTGLAHGLWTDRWTVAEDLAAAVARLEQVPLVLGDWEAPAAPPERQHSRTVAGSFTRRYVNRQTGKGVTVSLMCGRAGPLAAHTPDVCYEASGYEGGPLSTYTHPAGGAPPAAFYTACFRKARATEQSTLRIFWSWNATGTWQVASNPRLAFAHQPVLYKLYLLRELTTAREPLEEEPCIDLLNHLLPALQRVLPAGA
jgi:hypothetical protein